MTLALARLKTRADFLRVAGQRRKWASPGLILQVAPCPGGGDAAAGVPCPDPQAGPQGAGFACCVAPMVPIRIGFTCSKKVGNAVARNRARRRLKAAVDELFPDLASPGLDYVVIGRRETVSRAYSLLLQDLRTALKRVGALRPPDGPGAAASAGEGARR